MLSFEVKEVKHQFQTIGYYKARVGGSDGSNMIFIGNEERSKRLTKLHQRARGSKQELSHVHWCEDWRRIYWRTKVIVSCHIFSSSPHYRILWIREGEIFHSWYGLGSRLAIKETKNLKMDFPVDKGEDGKLKREGTRININKMYPHGPHTHNLLAE